MPRKKGHVKRHSYKLAHLQAKERGLEQVLPITPHHHHQRTNPTSSTPTLISGSRLREYSSVVWATATKAHC